MMGLWFGVRTGPKATRCVWLQPTARGYSDTIQQEVAVCETDDAKRSDEPNVTQKDPRLKAMYASERGTV